MFGIRFSMFFYACPTSVRRTNANEMRKPKINDVCLSLCSSSLKLNYTISQPILRRETIQKAASIVIVFIVLFLPLKEHRELISLDSIFIFIAGPMRQRLRPLNWDHFKVFLFISMNKTTRCDWTNSTPFLYYILTNFFLWLTMSVHFNLRPKLDRSTPHSSCVYLQYANHDSMAHAYLIKVTLPI